MKPIITKSGVIKPRYSNYYSDEMIGAPSASDLGLPSGGSGSGLFNSSATSWINSLIDAMSTTAQSIWGKGDKYRVQALQYINDEQSKTTKILWVVIGLMIVVGAVVLIKKTK